jgi:hypothetical protein
MNVIVSFSKRGRKEGISQKAISQSDEIQNAVK